MAVGNLAPLIPALFTGPNGERLTADQIKRRQEIAESLMAQATDTSPNAGGWASILAKGVQGFAAGRERRSADNASSTNAAESQKRLSSMLGIFTGGAPASSTTPSIGGLPPAVSTGTGAELAATSPAIPTVDISGDKQTFVASLLPAAIEESKRTGVDPRIIVAQAAQETGWGKSAPGNNYFGIKSHGQGGGQNLATNEVINGKTVRINDSFRQFGSPEESVRGYGDFILQNPRYQPLREAQGLDAQLEALQASGYATDPNYSRSVGAIARGIPLPGAGAAIESVAPAAPTTPATPASTGYTDTIAAPNFSEPPREIAAAPSVAQALVQPSAPVVAQPPVVTQPSIAKPQINPVVIEALTSQYASPEERQVAQMLFSDFQQEKDRAEKQALAQQQRAAEIAMRQAIAQQTGIDPSYAADDDIWKGAAGNLFAPPSTSIVKGAVIDNRTGQPIYQAPVDPQTYSGYAAYEQSQGRTPLGPLEYEQALRRSGASQTNVDTGTIPPGYRAVRDEQGRVIQYEPIPGGPAATDAATLERTTERQAGARETASRVVTDAATRALEAMQAPGLPATGVAGGAMSWLPESNAAELRRQVDVLKSNATVENLNAMRAASPTGGALGSVTEKEGAMLAAKSGTLDPNSPNFARDVKDYTRTLLEVTHGPKVGKEIFDKMRWPGQAEEAEEAPPPDVDPEDWKFMSPEDRALFK